MCNTFFWGKKPPPPTTKKTPTKKTPKNQTKKTALKDQRFTVAFRILKGASRSSQMFLGKQILVS